MQPLLNGGIFSRRTAISEPQDRRRGLGECAHKMSAEGFLPSGLGSAFEFMHLRKRHNSQQRQIGIQNHFPDLAARFAACGQTGSRYSMWLEVAKGRRIKW